MKTKIYTRSEQMFLTHYNSNNREFQDLLIFSIFYDRIINIGTVIKHDSME